MRILPLDNLPAPLLEAARSVSARLLERGYEAWIVGGAVRDLLLNLTPKDVDIATNAHPDEVERLFEKTMAVGKAFGTIVVHQGIGGAASERAPESTYATPSEATSSVDIEVTTYRADGEYLDGRRPETVIYSETLEEDAARRDFTCNALFASALTGELRDPTGGEPDLANGILRCVGVARDRFAEDGLRLMRLARFEGRFGLEPAPETLKGARDSIESLRGVSPERIRVELEGMFATSNPGRALARMADLGLFDRIFEGLPDGKPGLGDWEARSQLFSSSAGNLPMAVGFALLLGTLPGTGMDPELAGRVGEPSLEFLRPSKALQRAVVDIWSAIATLDELIGVAEPKPSQFYSLFRSAAWPDVMSCAEHLATGASADVVALERAQLVRRLDECRQGLTEAELSPAPFLGSEDLASSGITRGPRWGEILREAETLQLDGVLTDLDSALEWLAAQARAAGS